MVGWGTGTGALENLPGVSNVQLGLMATADSFVTGRLYTDGPLVFTHWLSFSMTVQGSVWTPGRPGGFWNRAPVGSHPGRRWLRSPTLESGSPGSHPAREPTCCVTLSKCLYLSEPLVPYMQHGQLYLFRRFVEMIKW